jgi:predicted nucleic acid-binding Zn ribbon protein
VDVKADPRVCKDATCIDELDRRETSERRMRTWMLIFFGLFAFTFIGPVLLRAAG